MFGLRDRWRLVHQGAITFPIFMLELFELAIAAASACPLSVSSFTGLSVLQTSGSSFQSGGRNLRMILPAFFGAPGEHLREL
jgi:hypothetical protein